MRQSRRPTCASSCSNTASRRSAVQVSAMAGIRMTPVADADGHRHRSLAASEQAHGSGDAADGDAHSSSSQTHSWSCTSSALRTRRRAATAGRRAAASATAPRPRRPPISAVGHDTGSSRRPPAERTQRLGAGVDASGSGVRTRAPCGAGRLVGSFTGRAARRRRHRHFDGPGGKRDGQHRQRQQTGDRQRPHPMTGRGRGTATEQHVRHRRQGRGPRRPSTASITQATTPCRQVGIIGTLPKRARA